VDVGKGATTTTQNEYPAVMKEGMAMEVIAAVVVRGSPAHYVSTRYLFRSSQVVVIVMVSPHFAVVLDKDELTGKVALRRRTVYRKYVSMDHDITGLTHGLENWPPPSTIDAR
jgi:hypothetical protein